MAWYMAKDKNNRGWAINPEGCAHLLRSCEYNRQLAIQSKTVTRSMGFLLPTVTEVDTNFAAIRNNVKQNVAGNVTSILNECSDNPEALFDFLVRAREDSDTAGAAYHQLVRSASTATSRAISSNVDKWENAQAVAKFTRDLSAGTLLVGATVLSGGTALAYAGAGTALTLGSNMQDNVGAGQSTSLALKNAVISTTITVATTVLIPNGLGKAASAMRPAQAVASTAENIAVGLLTTQANIAGDMLKTALVADKNISPAMRAQAQKQLESQVGARAAVEIGSMLFSTWLQSRGVPARLTLQIKDGKAPLGEMVSGSLTGVINDRIVASVSDQEKLNSVAGLDMAPAHIVRISDAEAFVRTTAIYPI